MAGENDSGGRWRKIAIEQLTYALGLILTWTIATLGYWFVLSKDGGFNPGSSARCAMLLSLFGLTSSAVTGFACVLNRLWDFRGTARRASKHPNPPDKEHLRSLGRMTWNLTYATMALFALGVVALATALLLTYGGKLT